MPMAILGWGGGVGNRGDLRDIPNTNEAHINWCSWVRGDGVGEKGGGDLCKKANNYRIATKCIYMYSYLHLYIYVVGGLERC